MEDGIVAVLPSLVGEAAVGHPAIFDEAVAVGVAERVDPFERGEDVRPDHPDRLEIAGPAVIIARQHDEERRGVDGAVIAARSDEHTSELQSLMRISYAVFCLKK